MQLLASFIPYNEICNYETSMTMNIISEVQDNGFVQSVFDNADHNTRTVDGHLTFHVMGGGQCVTPVSAVQTCSCIPPWIGARLCPKGGRAICPTRGQRLPDRGHDLLYGATSVKKLVSNYR
ncbi:hypothetical protein AVEN_128510-1 [Araneus ventricosus]|uniref:Uncharacterized protein n=1 Tax=Araneus ventricosus TaxID=182803 RepID=A0A4Y2ADJ9_ARAVE|nr:hypothetical protein AVEN_128510-1 [Araneus ventricosus]